MKDLLTLAESKALRGIAIIGIVLHNYCHFLRFAVKENEYTFDIHKPMAFMDRLLTLNHDLFIHFFSFLGHYGVPVFLFISGYGLVAKYEKQGAGRIKPLPFMRNHYLKLLRLMSIGYAVFIIVYFIRNSNGLEVYSWDKVAAQLTMTINFLYERPDRVIKPGPYWYFGLMLQLYAVYALLLSRWRSAYVSLASVAVCWLIQYMAFPSTDTLNFVRYNFIGGMLPFVAGIMYARHGIRLEKTASLALLLVSAAVVLAGSMSFLSWLWVPLFVATGAVATVRLLPGWILKPCIWMGGLSSAMFVMHPVVREVVIGHYRTNDIYFGIIVFVLSSVALSMLLQYILRYIPNPNNK